MAEVRFASEVGSSSSLRTGTRCHLRLDPWTGSRECDASVRPVSVPLRCDAHLSSNSGSRDSRRVVGLPSLVPSRSLSYCGDLSPRGNDSVVDREGRLAAILIMCL